MPKGVEHEISDRHELLASKMAPIDVLAYNEWLFHPELMHLLAAFVQPNDPALHPLVSSAADYLGETTGDRGLAGYQHGGPGRVQAILEALHGSLSDEAQLSYINPPPSFEKAGQKVRLVGDTLTQKRGTCLDLAVLQAALWAHVGLHPVIVIVPGHAMVGCWLENALLPEPVARIGEAGESGEELVQALQAGALLPLNSVEVATGESLDNAARAAAQIINQAVAQGDHVIFIDVVRAREQVTPLP